MLTFSNNLLLYKCKEGGSSFPTSLPSLAWARHLLSLRTHARGLTSPSHLLLKPWACRARATRHEFRIITSSRNFVKEKVNKKNKNFFPKTLDFWCVTRYNKSVKKRGSEYVWFMVNRIY